MVTFLAHSEMYWIVSCESLSVSSVRKHIKYPCDDINVYVWVDGG